VATVDGRRLLTLEQAARYLGMSRDSFERRRAQMPAPLYPFGVGSDARWDVVDLDAHIAALKAPQTRAAEICDAIEQGQPVLPAKRRGRGGSSGPASASSDAA